MKIFWWFLSLFVFSSFILPYDDIKIISSNNQSLLIEYKPFYIDTSIVLLNNREYYKVNVFLGIPSSENQNAPFIPNRQICVGVPGEFGNNIQVVASEFEEINGSIIPIGYSHPEFQFSEEEYYNYNNKDLVSFGEYGLARDIPVQYIKVFPVQFNSTENKIRLYSRIRIKINFAPKKYSGSKITNNLFSNAIINYEIAKDWIITTNSELKKSSTLNSVLSEGKWYRFETPEEGIYKIDRNTLSAIGIDPNSVDPRTIKIYNNGGKELPENILQLRPSDLLENAIFVSGEEDGKFDAADYILFYGRGIHFWEYDTTKQKMIRYFHTYSAKNYYWITSGGNNGKRMQQKINSTSTPQIVQLTTKAFKAWEEDKTNILSAGRIFVGDEFTKEIKTHSPYTNKLDALIPGSKIDYRFNFINKSNGIAELIISENSNEIYKTNIFSASVDDARNFIGSTSFTGNLPDNRSILKFTYNPSLATGHGYINFFEIYYEKYLKAVNGELFFYSPDTSAIVEYRLSEFPSSNIKVFDISNYSEVKIVCDEYISGGECNFKFSEDKSKLSKYIAVEKGAFKVPTNIHAVGNSNLHGISKGAQFIIITHKNFINEAERLKSHKENDLNISTIVINTEDIFNEFSCGITDVCAIRDFIKYAYDNWEVQPEYVLLFGDGDYDYKNIEGKNQNFVIPYETVESFSKIYAYASDDFYARIAGNDNILDICIGRINVNSVEEATIAVNKIISYENNHEAGLWKNRVCLVADDEYAPNRSIVTELDHTKQSETLSKIFPGYFHQKKIYSVLYDPVQTSSGERKPLVFNEIIKTINEGTLLMNYFGHGWDEGWADEQIFHKSTSIPQLKNENYIFLIAATCSFAKYDNHGEENKSATELLMSKPDGGTIGVLASVRDVYGQQNASLDYAFTKNLFSKGTSNSIGKAHVLAKTQYSDFENNSKFHLFGDPTLKLKIPEISIEVDSINGNTSTSEMQLKALSKVKINGTVKNYADYNGTGIISVYDSERNFKLDKYYGVSISKQGGIIYKGQIEFINGKFTAEFTVPKDISYENEKGKIVVYANNDLSDLIGYSENFTVGGTDTSVVNDGEGPKVDICFEDEKYENSYLVTPSATLLVRLTDETGLNTTGNGIGHNLEGILNDDEYQPIDLTNYFTGDLNTAGCSGVIKYKFNNLEKGDYKIKIKAWDVFNNFSSADAHFTVVEGDKLVITDVYNYPNPFNSSTTFTFQQNLPLPVNVRVKIFTVTGRLIKVIEKNMVDDKFVKIDWDGFDADGNLLSNGTYFYKLHIKTIDDEFSREVIGKLAVIR